MLGNGLNSYEKQLCQEHAAALEITGLTRREARAEAKRRITKAIAESKRDGFYGSEPLGRAALEAYKTDPKWLGLYDAEKNAGMTDDDFLEWWDTPDVERRLMMIDDACSRTALFLSRMDEGLTSEQAAKEVWKAFPMFGDCRDGPVLVDDDGSVPLPWELKFRIIRWLERMQVEGRLQELRPESGGFTTMNGYVRHLIGKGEI